MPVHAFVFPGQGSQSVGMGRDLAAAFAAAREVFQEVDETLKQNLSRLMFEGPGEELVLTENTQPALMAHSLAVLRVLETQGKIKIKSRAIIAAGHSLGEYSALCAVGAFTIADAARLLKLRGQSMQKAVPAGEGAMAALLGADMAQAEEICAEAAVNPEGQKEVVEPANDNGGGQVVISGHRSAIERAVEISKTKGIRRAMLLPVSAPFHCALMQPAQEEVARVLAVLPLTNPRIPVAANVTGGLVTTSEAVCDALIHQVTGAVRWVDCMQSLKAIGADLFIEVGPGKVLCGLLKQIDPSLKSLNVEDATSLEKTLAELAGGNVSGE